ncbi:MAG: Stk1 family PASTA domain-containing Ser/Thr kinase [Lachnospiraceae bacterium]
METIKIGMLIGDRYEILDKIGTGGMSDVYKAKCHKLNRNVAIKVLKQEFSENTNFVHKFRVEAQAAAGLMHPNIVNVYDVGEENGIYYIVMELVDGITLKKYIEKKARLSVKESISIAIQISMGIEAAHNNHIIHRDIKPQNIIISKEGKVKVTDFGIAKAATSNTITSNVMGSVHYTSPEQARGGYSDEKSDIYSLGITFFEMLTGRVPFNGETTVAIAIKHIQEEMPSPRDYVPEIPVSVEQIVFKCTQKSPDRRYQTMKELIGDLKKSLINPEEDFVKVVDFNNKEETKLISDHELQQIQKQSSHRDYMEEEIRLQAAPKKKGKSKNSTVNTTGNANGKMMRTNKKTEQKPEYEDEFNPKMEKITTVLTIIVAVIIGCILLFFAGRAVGIFPLQDKDGATQQVQPGQAIMPEVIGKSLDEAQTAMEEQGILMKVTYDISSEYGKNTVMGSSVEAGSAVEKETEVVLTISAGADGMKVPDVVNKSEAEATAALEKTGFIVKKEESVSDKVAKGNIISQSPQAGEIISRDASVTIVISNGAKDEMVEVPDVRGMTETDAKAALGTVGFACTAVTEVDNSEYEAGTVCYQSYSAGTSQPIGTDIELKLSLGATYSCNLSVNAPADYRTGDATVILTAADTGVVLFNTGTSGFPVAINISNIKTTDTGILSIAYTKPSYTDADGKLIDAHVVTEEQPVQFTKE